MKEKIRIKDIAEKSGVSVGTVDRVLHNRPNVSKSAREKVESVLNNINYQPNMYASALAYNKSYTFYCIIPKHESEAYWEEIEEGASTPTRTASLWCQASLKPPKPSPTGFMNATYRSSCSTRTCQTLNRFRFTAKTRSAVDASLQKCSC